MNTTTEKTRRGTASGRAGSGDASLKEKLRGMALTRSTVVRNGRFFFSSDLNALTYWYEDHTHSTRMVYIQSDS